MCVCASVFLCACLDVWRAVVYVCVCAWLCVIACVWFVMCVCAGVVGLCEAVVISSFLSGLRSVCISCLSLLVYVCI